MTIAPPPPCPEPTTFAAPSDGAAVVTLRDVSYRRGHQLLLAGVDLTLHRGELVAIAGPSGAGKSTLLRVVAGLSRASSGTVTYAGERSDAAGRTGFVPQDDIVPLDLSVRRVLSSGARLVLDESPSDLRRRVDTVLAATGLEHRADAPVRRLSGGERKRVNVAVELLTEPELFLLDEPTSGLDPAASAALLDRLRVMADCGASVTLTTHSTADIERCDRVVFVARGGSVAFVGTPAAARAHFRVTELADVYVRLDGRAAAIPARPAPEIGRRVDDPARRRFRPATSAGRQWRALTVRSAAQLFRNRLTLAILVGSPVLVTLMMATLFPNGGFARATASIGVQESYWLCFAAFFFGLTYGLLQIVVELPIVRRDRARGVRMTAYLAAKVTVLVPILLAVDLLMLVVLRELGRLPGLDASGWVRLGATIGLTSLAALATGLAASAAVADTTQATLALPMICFPQVLFAGILVARARMTAIGRAMSDVLVTRFGFAGIGRSLGTARLLVPSDPYTQTFTDPLGHAWIALGLITATMLTAAWIVLRVRTAPR